MRTHYLASRFAVGLIAAFGMFGVMVYAFGDEETLAGPPIGFLEDPDGAAVVGTCPPTFPIEVVVKDDPADSNGDHTVCTDEKGRRFVDNDFLGDADDPAQVNGHGNFFDAGKKIQQDISFSFHGMNTGHGSKGFSEAAKGEFEYHDQTGQGPTLAVHGDVVCLSVSGNTALLVGKITDSNDIALPVDTVVAWLAQDNGEGINEPVDLVSRPSPIGSKLPKESCAFKLPALKLNLIVSGNIQVQ
ncbi:MAG TPA: hypothetical protein VJN96_26370 [Vicinamibacterales bacterium]|nr:hypothetical protein [Vicinamibacterales bacterium]